MDAQPIISKIKTPDGTTYLIKDATARDAIEGLNDIARTGNVKYLVQDEEDILVLDCGGAFDY